MQADQRLRERLQALGERAETVDRARACRRCHERHLDVLYGFVSRSWTITCRTCGETESVDDAILDQAVDAWNHANRVRLTG